MRLNVLPDERFSCKSCTDCCRNYLVELFHGEAQKIATLPWADSDPLANTKALSNHAGKTYLAHRSNGACVFLNESNGLCRIHEQFGYDAKPMACRLYPFQVTPTFAGEASVTARYDCPAVRRNEGAPYAEALPLIRKYVAMMPAQAGFDEAVRCHLDREQITAVAEFASTLLGAFERDEERALFIVFLSDVLSTTAVDQVNREALAAIFLPLKQQVESAAAVRARRPGLFQRLAFRTLLGLHLRRDEDVFDGRASRFRRLLAMMAFVLGFGSFRGLGLYHPPGSLRRARLFGPAFQTEPDAFALLWRLVRNKLDAFEFLGAANGNRDFLAGLRSLALLYPLVKATAKHHAASRASTRIDSSDIEYGVAAIEHSFGRSAVLSAGITRPMETMLLDRKVFAGLASTV